MNLGYQYWIPLWIAMAAAFLFAWLFIVRGCEILDRKTELSGEELDGKSGGASGDVSDGAA